MKHFGDITKISGLTVPPVDVITGGSPCQDLSVAGKRAGIDGERSGLFMEQIRVIKEMRSKYVRIAGSNQLVRLPRFAIWENVPGAFSSNKGKDFQAVLSEFVRIAEPGAPDVPMPEGGRWPKAGCLYDELGNWSIAWRLHDAQFWGIPQRRKRIALVADFGGLSAPEVLFERKGLSRDPEPCAPARKETARATGGGADCAEPILLESNQNHATIQMDGISTTLPASMGMGGGYVPMTVSIQGNGNRVTDYTALAVGNGQLNQMSMAEQANTLDTMHDQQAVIVFDKEMYNSGKAMRGEMQARFDNVAPTCRADSHPSGVLQNVVRRLTPMECERLQGFPDTWTDIGEWIDSKGKKHKGADSPRYKALGNSIALPFWQYLARRICAQYERPVTMASLFDGIGGFPLVFQRCGAIPVWGSEIDEFPMAVTKLRFPE